MAGCCCSCCIHSKVWAPWEMPAGGCRAVQPVLKSNSRDSWWAGSQICAQPGLKGHFGCSLSCCTKTHVNHLIHIVQADLQCSVRDTTGTRLGHTKLTQVLGSSHYTVSNYFMFKEALGTVWENTLAAWQHEQNCRALQGVGDSGQLLLSLSGVIVQIDVHVLVK